jgi:hypothetical protein
MRTAVILTAGVTLMVLIGCSSLQVSSDYAPDADFGKYKTFGWPGGDRPPEDALAKNPLVAKRIEMSINNALKAKGFELMETGKPDLVIITHAGVQEKMQVTTSSYGGYYGGYGGYGGYGMYDPWGYGGTQTDVSYYDEGTLIIDFVDVEAKDLVWRGTATKTLEDVSDPERMQKNIDKVVEKMLATFPPGS